jgi:type IV pilus assembly protein PilB
VATQPSYSLFGQRLVELNIITKKQLDEAIHKQQTSMRNRRLGEILVRMGYIAKSHITQGLSEQLGIPVVKISERQIPDRIIGLVEPNIATVYRIIPLGEEGNKIIIATADPTNYVIVDNLERLLDRQVEAHLATEEEISLGLAKYYKLSEKSVESMLSTVSSASSMSSLSTMSNVSSLDSSLSSMSMSDVSLSSISMGSVDIEGVDTSAIPGMISEDDEDANSPVVKYVHQLVIEAFRLRASDIHVEPGKMDIKIRYRIDGVLQLMPPPPKRAQASIISRLKIMAGMDISEKRVPQDGRIKLAVVGGKLIDLRVSCLPSTHGETIVMRILDKSGLMLGLGQLGLSPENQRTWEDVINSGTGVVLVTGPTGSGKTTTLYASLHNLNKPTHKLITVEDPVEYQLTGINQVQINHDIGWDFSRALRAIFRQDPDIVMVGEIRDVETAEIAIKAALTGHLVFSTLHTNDAPSAFIRMVDQGVKPFLVASGIRAIMGQRLVRTICVNCKEVYKATEQDQENIGFLYDLSKVETFRGKGCDACNHTGYQGRLGVHELLNNTDEMRRLIMSGAAAGPLRRCARKTGMLTMREDGWKKVLNGVTTIEEVVRQTQLDEPLR